MVAKAKLYSQLDRLEAELRDRLIPHLEQASKGQNALIFCVPEFSPFPAARFKTDPETQELVLLGRQALSLREKLGEPTHGVIAERLCWYCRKWGDDTDGHRTATERLASDFLGEVLNAEQPSR